MTTLADALVARLADGGAIEAVIGQRVYPLRLPELPTGLPALVYQRVAAPGLSTHTGAFDNTERRFQLSIYDDDYSRGEEARAVILAELDGTSTVWGAGGPTVTCRKADDAEDIDPEPGGLYRQRVDLYLQSNAA